LLEGKECKELLSVSKLETAKLQEIIDIHNQKVNLLDAELVMTNQLVQGYKKDNENLNKIITQEQKQTKKWKRRCFVLLSTSVGVITTLIITK
jgi:septal ring factor EnvC (AmiA/AmiB activator)